VKSIYRNYREDLFRFVDNLEIELTNNLIERGLRHAIVIKNFKKEAEAKKELKLLHNPY